MLVIIKTLTSKIMVIIIAWLASNRLLRLSAPAHHRPHLPFDPKRPLA
ncbi:hypothetical protein GGR77_002289 [Xanthomonas translucens]